VHEPNKSMKSINGPTEGSLAIYIHACGRDHKAGMLFWRLAFLCRKTNLIRDDVRWYIRSRHDLMKDLALSKHEYDRAVRVLRGLEFIETSNAAKLGVFYMSMQTTAFSITEKGHEAISWGRSIVANSYKGI
jgi:hypothetical protein